MATAATISRPNAPVSDRRDLLLLGCRPRTLMIRHVLESCLPLFQTSFQNDTLQRFAVFHRKAPITLYSQALPLISKKHKRTPDGRSSRSYNRISVRSDSQKRRDRAYVIRRVDELVARKKS